MTRYTILLSFMIFAIGLGCTDKTIVGLQNVQSSSLFLPSSASTEVDSFVCSKYELDSMLVAFPNAELRNYGFTVFEYGSSSEIGSDSIIIDSTSKTVRLYSKVWVGGGDVVIPIPDTASCFVSGIYKSYAFAIVLDTVYTGGGISSWSGYSYASSSSIAVVNTTDTFLSVGALDSLGQ